MNIAQILNRSAKIYPDKTALLVGDNPVLTYAQLVSRVARLASALRNQYRVKPGDRVAIFASNCPEYLEALYAIYWIGAVSIPINFKLHPKELQYILEDSGAMVLMVSHDTNPNSAEITQLAQTIIFDSPEYIKALDSSPIDLVSRELDDVASLFYTSGTTGRPKGVMQTNRNLLAMSACYFTDVDDIQFEDTIIYMAPMSHGAGLYNYPFMMRAAKHLVPRSGGFDSAELIELAEKVGRLSFFAVPTMLNRLADYVDKHHCDISGIKTIVYGGAPMYIEDTKRALHILGSKLVQIYGQGESPMTITALAREHLENDQHPNWERRIASVGVPHSLMEVLIVDDNGAPVPNGTVGEVIAKGDTVMPGYWNQPEASAAALKNGWLYTGDTGFLDDDGFLTLKDRSKDLIISGGSNIYPREVEEVLLLHPTVSEVAVVGQFDIEWGEVPVAFVVANAVSAEELERLCLENLARFKRPKGYYFLETLPKNNYGKVLKTELRKLIKREK
jgi:acyl-CoA synthetase (AMP-forming)/AMP-acid ligase II